MKNDLLLKSPTGIQGFDEITEGGLPTGRPTLVCGDAGCGKTLFAMEFLYKGATLYNEPGVFMSFEENDKELITNVSSLGYDLQDLIDREIMLIDYVHVERSEIEESGEFDLEGLFVRLNLAIETVKAKRVVLDTIETLFGGLPNETILRSELRRLFRWLKDKGVTTIITGERGSGSLTRYGIEEYVSDCVIMLDHRIANQASTRRLRVVKYRGSKHGTNEYPFIIDSDGFSVLPITSMGLDHKVSSERISSGIPALDKMLGDKGFYRGSSILISGTAGTGKSSIASHFSSESCSKGERVLYFAFEESPKQIMRNMRSIGIDLEPWEKAGLLRFHTTRPTFYGLEMHLTAMIKEIKNFGPSIVIADPINSFVTENNPLEARSLSIRLIDFLKSNQITGLFTNLAMDDDMEKTNVFISSIIDTWIYLRDIELGGERNRGIYILKSRGMPHSNQIREFLLTDKGVKFEDVYVGMEGVLTGSARIAQEAREKASLDVLVKEIERKQLNLEQKRKAIEAQVSLLRAEFEAEEAELMNSITNEKLRKEKILQELEKMKHSRRGE